jgi:competence protein ComEC
MSRVWRYKFRRTTQQLLLFISLLAGIGLAKLEPTLNDLPAWLAVALLVVTWPKRRLATLVLMIICGLSLGYWRGAAYAQKLSLYNPYYDQKVTLKAVAGEDASYNKTKQLTFMAGRVVMADGQKLTGKVLLGGFGANAVFRGDEVTATGKLRSGYGAYQAKMSFAELDVGAHHSTQIYSLRRRFMAGMQSALPEPQAPFAMGLLVGQRATLPEEVKQNLRMVGLTHIIAVSGYNLTIIMQASRRVFGRLSKRLATGLSLGLIAVFLLLTGASASIVRAAIVSLLSIWASYYGRVLKPLNLLALTAVITAWFNPVYLWSDLSWHLSFLAFFGVMILAPLIKERWPGKWHGSLVGGVALESICAEVMSLPFVLYIFGQMSLVGLPANVLVVTMVPLAMLLGLIAGLAGMLCPAISGWFAWPATQLLTYMLDIAHWMAHIPHVFIENRSLSLPATLGLYGLILLIIATLRLKTKPARSAIITDRNVGSQQMVNY